jgi:hypothetical protein
MIVARAAVAGNPSAKSYWELIEEDGAKSYYKMDETSGSTCFDYGVNDEDGTYFNTPTLDQTGPSSSIPKAVLFETASSEYMQTNETADFNVNANSNWSGDCWFKYNDTGTTLRAVYSIRQLSGDNGSLFIILSNFGVAGRISVQVRLNNDTYLTLNHDGSWNNDSWHHVAVTATSGGAVRLYVDGVERASSSSTRVNNTSNRRLFLAANAGSQIFTGRIAAPAYYDRTLSAAEVDEHYQEGI